MIGKNCKPDPVADPFGERVSDTYSERHSVLGGHFDFVTSRQRLLRLARSAFARAVDSQVSRVHARSCKCISS